MKNVETTSIHTDARWVAELHLPTGKVRRIAGDWKPSHWDNDNRWITDAAKGQVREIREGYGITDVEVRIYRETRTTTRQEIIETGRKLHSTLPAVTS